MSALAITSLVRTPNGEYHPGTRAPSVGASVLLVVGADMSGTLQPSAPSRRLKRGAAQ
jgi:hypothetical protein